MARTHDPDLRSMTGFAAQRGAGEGGYGWAWEMRAVNGKGFDLRLRLPDGLEPLEQKLRASVAETVQRGTVSVTLKLTRDSTVEGFALQPKALEAALVALAEVEAHARAQRLTLAPVTAADVLQMRGVMETRRPDDQDLSPLTPALLADFAQTLRAFDAMRATEGAALVAVLDGQLAQIATLVDAARTQVEARRDQAATSLAEAMARILGAVDADPARIAQELALMAVKADVAEELDRLQAHVAAARALLSGAGPVGRKLDFLMQEFNREANTLCSKAQAIALTQIGLDLKHVIDQMREQVQNLE